MGVLQCFCLVDTKKAYAGSKARGRGLEMRVSPHGAQVEQVADSGGLGLAER